MKIRTLLALFIFCRAALPASDSCADLAPALHELYAARYDRATELYRAVLKTDPHCGAAYEGLVRSLLRSHHAEEAYAVADAALAQAPGQAGSLSAGGMALFRKGLFQKAEKAWLDALAIDPKNASAMQGLIRVRLLVAKYKTAEMYTGMVYRLTPDDPGVIVRHAETLKGPEHIAELERALAIYDPKSREARVLRAHIAADQALGDRKTAKLTSGYHPYEIKLMPVEDGPKRLRGFALRVSFNGERPATLLLDTGASGISLAPHLAEKFGLSRIGDQAFEARGIGNGVARDSFDFLASSIRIGDLEFQDYPLSVFDSAKTQDFDGLIGANVFARFLVTIDFPNRVLNLEPFKDYDPKQAQSGPRDASPLPAGLSRVYQLNHLLVVPTLVNTDTSPNLFIVDSGSSSNLIDPAVAGNTTKTHSDSQTIVKGLQGRVNKVSRADEATLFFAGFRQRNPDLIAIDLKGNSDAVGVAVGGILGMTVLIHLSVTIDYRDGGIHFEYKPIGQ